MKCTQSNSNESGRVNYGSAPISRRAWLTSTTSLLSSTALLQAGLHAAEKRQPKIVLRSSWQTVNIGDIGHTPGVLTLLEQHFPEAAIRLWPSSIGDGVRELLLQRFPKLEIADSREQVGKALSESDFLLHGSGASLVATKDVLRWREETSKPYGVFGITWSTDGKSPAEVTKAVDLLNQASFVYFRDTVSLEAAKNTGCTAPVLDFGPDGAFAVDLKNEAAADSFLKGAGLEPRKFVCCIPRLRYTPYWKIKPNVKYDETKHARNEAMKEHDHAPLRDAIERLVRETDLKVLLCPEDRSQMAVAKELLWDPLPDDIRRRVVWRSEYWLTDEALSVYRRSLGLFGLEMHSPIMCVGNGIPALVGRFAEQTSKGYMWRDIGLGEWLFDLDQPGDGARISSEVLSVATEQTSALAKTARARDAVAQRHREMVATLRNTIERLLA